MMHRPIIQSISSPENIYVKEDFSSILHEFGWEFRITDPYLLVGSIKNKKGWILHLSIIRPELAPIIRKIISCLTFHGVPFKIPLNEQAAANILDGQFGFESVGKVITIYPESEGQTDRLTNELIQLTKHSRGPRVPTDFHWGGCLYAHYSEDRFSEEINLSASSDNRYKENTTNSSKYQLKKGKRKLLKSYMPTRLIKIDGKGFVCQGINFKKLFRPDWCLIKEGRNNMFCDDQGRDMKDRLIWQKELANHLLGKVRIPKFIDHFTLDDNGYLITEFIEGRLLDTVVADTFGNFSWTDLPLEKKEFLLGFLLQAIEIIRKFHEEGCVHRDITPGNFIVDKKNHLTLIDMELAYSIQFNNPFPPFTLGTNGFMSPEQIRVELPTTKEDIYGLGATILYSFTNLAPFHFDVSDKSNFFSRISDLIRDDGICELILSCFEDDPNQRPDILGIRDTLEVYKRSLSNY